MDDSLIKTGLVKALIKFNDDKTRITYLALNKTYNFKDPEEIVRAHTYIELLEKYQYSKDKIDLEVIVPRRTPNDLADIVIYEDTAKLKPYIVVECKADGITNLEFIQAIEQVFGNANSLRAQFATVIAGNTSRYFDVKNYPSNERTKNIIADIPVSYGKVQEFKYKKDDTNWDIKPISKQELIRILQKCHDTLWDGGKMAPTEAFDELSKIIFVKIRDEQKPRRAGDPYDFQIKTYEGASSVYERVINIYKEAQQVDPNVFNEDIISPPEKLLTVVNHLQGINLSKTDLDTKGVAFERFMEDFFKGKQGQYFTPREIVNFIVDISDFDNNSRILDPACGSGGFLLYSLDKIRKRATEYYAEGTAENYKFWHDFASNNLFGIEVNEKIARVAKMNMILHDDGHTNVIGFDALEKFSKMQELNQKFRKDSFDLIVTNPPFGAVIKKEEKDYIGDFFLGKTKNGKAKDTQKSEILFIERCWEFLKPETGKIAIILPDGILTNTTQKYVRDFILEKFQIEAVFSIPQVTFLHYGAGVKSSIFVLRKKGADERVKDYEIFMSVINLVGYDATGRHTKSDLLEVKSRFNIYKTGKLEKSDYLTFTRNLSELTKNRIDAYYYSPLFDDIKKRIAKCGHKMVSLISVCVDDGIFNGKTPAKDQYSENSADAKIIKVANLKKMGVNFENMEYISPDFEPTKFIQDGDILLLSAAHQAEYLGRNPCVVVIPKELKDEKLTFVGELLDIRANKEKVNPYYLLQLLSTRDYFLIINREKRGQTSHLYSEDLGSVEIPIPTSVKEQNENANKFLERYKKYQEYVQKAEKLLQDCVDDFKSEFLS